MELYKGAICSINLFIGERTGRASTKRPGPVPYASYPYTSSASRTDTLA